MTFLLDTSFLLATIDSNDKNHEAVLNVARRPDVHSIVPTSVLPELCYLITSRLGHNTMQVFLSQLVTSAVSIEPIRMSDLQRAAEILEKYSDSYLDFVDATLVAIAERKNITVIGTLDRRDFSIIRPNHCDYFELLP